MTNDDSIDDGEALYSRATRGDGPALAGLIESYMPRLREFVRVHIGQDLRQRFSAEDVVQSVCLDLAEHADALRFDDERRFRAWLFKAASHKLSEKARFHRREKRDVGREHADVDDENANALLLAARHVATPSRQIAAREELARFENALDCLSDDHREVIALARIAGLPHEIVAEQMGRSVGAVRKLLGRALLAVSASLDQSDAP
ncbi:MAG: sigma-70 family RNA polymerase sigma factor [Planctomycetes bacterium]|nr:sigma-70 family RNA polymerase sigma factor [Planctomycetota bacterium]